MSRQVIFCANTLSLACARADTFMMMDELVPLSSLVVLTPARLHAKMPWEMRKPPSGGSAPDKHRGSELHRGRRGRMRVRRWCVFGYSAGWWGHHTLLFRSLCRAQLAAILCQVLDLATRLYSRTRLLPAATVKRSNMAQLARESASEPWPAEYTPPKRKRRNNFHVDAKESASGD